MEVRIVPYRSDNYGFLAHHKGQTIAIDAGDDEAYFDALAKAGWALDHILITHHHDDHISHLERLKAATGGQAWGPQGVKGLDYVIAEGASCPLDFQVIATPGHTLDMLSFAGHGAVFTGDTLFTLGCGRIFEGTPQMMWQSLQKLAVLPDETLVYGAHEYSLANLDFALSEFPLNEALNNRAQIIRALRAEGKPTVPSTMGLEKATNPFMLAKNATDFARIRKAKDVF